MMGKKKQFSTISISARGEILPFDFVDTQVLAKSVTGKKPIHVT